MNKRIFISTLTFLLLIVCGGLWVAFKPPIIWVTGYLPAYRQTETAIPFLSRADYQMLTHLSHVSAIPRADGSLDTDTNALRLEQRQVAVKAAHAEDVPILLVILGNHEQFTPAISPPVRQTFIRNILALLDSSGYDGVDIDMEPITRDEKVRNPDFSAFITELHAALQTRLSPLLLRPPLLTTAVTLRDRYIVAELAAKFDQINLMTYDMAQPHEGWVTWFDSALSNGGFQFPGTDRPLPSVGLWVQQFLQAGVPRGKLGIGISLSAGCWQGGEGTSTGGTSLPRQSWTSPPTYFKQSYADLMAGGFPADAYHWDETAQMAYLSIDKQGSADDLFCSFNDARALAAKLAYLKRERLGGLIIWELSLDQREGLPADQNRPLRRALAHALEK